MWTQLKEKMRRLGWRQWSVLLLVGLLLTVISLPVSEKKSSTVNVGEKAVWTTEDTGAEKSRIETRLEKILSETEGVGMAEVMIMTTGEKNSFGSGSSGDIQVTGVLIAAQGADSAVTVQNIRQAVMALFQIEAHKIRVIKMR